MVLFITVSCLYLSAQIYAFSDSNNVVVIKVGDNFRHADDTSTFDNYSSIYRKPLALLNRSCKADQPLKRKSNPAVWPYSGAGEGVGLSL